MALTFPENIKHVTGYECIPKYLYGCAPLDQLQHNFWLMRFTFVEDHQLSTEQYWLSFLDVIWGWKVEMCGWWREPHSSWSILRPLYPLIIVFFLYLYAGFNNMLWIWFCDFILFILAPLEYQQVHLILDFPGLEGKADVSHTHSLEKVLEGWYGHTNLCACQNNGR